jgi:hypothetical protein
MRPLRSVTRMVLRNSSSVMARGFFRSLPSKLAQALGDGGREFAEHCAERVLRTLILESSQRLRSGSSSLGLAVFPRSDG